MQRSGTWFSYGENRLGQGRENARTFLKEHEEVRARLDSELRESLGIAAAREGPSAPSVPVAAAQSRRTTRAVAGST